jgi:hypothetical protein
MSARGTQIPLSYQTEVAFSFMTTATRHLPRRTAEALDVDVAGAMDPQLARGK